MAAHSNHDDEMITGINVTPLVDIVLVLLVILMVTASYVATRTIPVDLPRGATGEQLPTTIAVSIDRDGKLYVDAEPVDEAELGRRVAAARAKDADTRATIAADNAVAHGRVVQVIDVLRQHDIVKFAINVDPAELASAKK